MQDKEKQNKHKQSKFWERQNMIADSSLSIREKWALQVIFMYASDRDEGKCFAKNKKIEIRFSLASSQTSELIGMLVKRGIINNQRTQSGSNIRTINWDVLAEFVNPETQEDGKTLPVSPGSRKYDSTASKSENADSVNPESRTPTYITSQRTSKGKSKRFRDDQIELPDSLNTDKFRKAWKEWCEYRRASKKPISETAAKKQIAKLAEFGPTESIAAIEKSIANDYTGLFPSTPKSKGDSSGKPNSRTNSGQIFDQRSRGEEILA